MLALAEAVVSFMVTEQAICSVAVKLLTKDMRVEKRKTLVRFCLQQRFVTDAFLYGSKQIEWHRGFSFCSLPQMRVGWIKCLFYLGFGTCAVNLGLDFAWSLHTQSIAVGMSSIVCIQLRKGIFACNFLNTTFFLGCMELEEGLRLGFG